MDEFRPRSYQQEMLEMSLRENIIVVMDTGSGKTHMYASLRLNPVSSGAITRETNRACMRIMAELQRCALDKIVWFLAPTVALSMQQKEVIASHIPAVNIRLLIGDDGVDRWSEQRIWDDALRGVRVVVSTHAVLAEALAHRFVAMARLALIVFDEAHHCVKNHPANRIMKDFYHPTKNEQGPESVPRILGLTASPIMRTKLHDMPQIERNLSAVCRTPRAQRQDLMKYVHPPQLILLRYCAPDDSNHTWSSPFLEAVSQAHSRALSHLELPNPSVFREVQDQLKNFHAKAVGIGNLLGTWAADYFIAESVKNLVERAGMSDSLWADPAKARLAEMLRHILQLAPAIPGSSSTVSEKVCRLLAFLKEEHHEHFSGIIFVRKRATAYVLAAVIRFHPLTQGLFQCASCVGWSKNRNRKSGICDLLGPGAEDALQQFRQGEMNLIVATDVLEEGIDLTACNLVVCFDQPNNLKSFIQRRGRARQQQSKFGIMIADNDMPKGIERWQELEDEMVRLYRDHKRKLEEIAKLENIPENVVLRMRLQNGALLTADSAVSHLYHFCSTLNLEPHADLRPSFSFKQNEAGHVRATVTLPSGVDQSLRVATGAKWWLTERAARKDAAFHAYIALHRAKLVNDHFLPLTPERLWRDVAGAQLVLTSKIAIEAIFDPWKQLAVSTGHKLHRSRMRISQNGQDRPDLAMILTTSVQFPATEPLELFWDSETNFVVSLHSLECSSISPAELQLMRETTSVLLSSARTKVPSSDAVGAPNVLVSPDIPLDELETWLVENRRGRNCLDWYRDDSSSQPHGLVRCELLYNKPHIFIGWIQPDDDSEPLVCCEPFPRRRNLLLKSTLCQRLSDRGNPDGGKSRTKQVPASLCTVDLLPWELSRASLLFSASMQLQQRLLIAAHLRDSVLGHLPCISLGVLADAITAPSAQWTSNYQRLEYLGDGVLKFAVCIQLFYDHPLWHEGYLSQRKSQIVSNASLAHAALKAGLGPFLLTEPMTSRKWMLPRVSDLPNPPRGKRAVSGKALADTLEALVGAAYVDGGMQLAWAMIHVFIPEVADRMPSLAPQRTSQRGFIMGPDLEEKIDRLIGYQFLDRSLVWEALTHPSWQRDLSTGSYQKLEFLGDAILDMIITDTLYKHRPPLTEDKMTKAKAAVTNAHFLAFLCMEFGLQNNQTCIRESESGEFIRETQEGVLEFWRFMRHDNADVSAAQKLCLERYRKLSEPIRACLATGNTYPWVSLAQLGAEKFYSDITESIIGALFIDSCGSIEQCEAFLTRIKILPYLSRILREEVMVEHPRSVLDRLAKSSRVEYNITRNASNASLYDVSVVLNDEVLHRVEGCLSQEECVVTGADLAIATLRDRSSRPAASIVAEF